MRIFSLLEVLAANLILVALLLWVSGEDLYRISYWETEGFTPTLVRYPLFFMTSAVKGSTSIPGLLTVDWQQVIILALVLIDAIYLWGVFRSRKSSGIAAS